METEQKSRSVALGRAYEHLLNLLRLAILPLFVFDGPTRPSLKRRRQVYTGTFHIEQPFRQLVAKFGMECWSAPGEAEAELAMLCHRGLVDVVMTNDSDAMCALCLGYLARLSSWQALRDAARDSDLQHRRVGAGRQRAQYGARCTSPLPRHCGICFHA